MELYFNCIIIGIVLFVVGFCKRSRNDGVIVVTGTVVAMRMEVERRYIRGMLFRKFFYYRSDYTAQLGDHTVSGWNGKPVTVYKPIVRFAYLGGAQEAVVDEATEHKPELNVSMQIAFSPKNPAKAWRPDKDFLWSDMLMFAGGILVLFGVLGLAGFMPFFAGGSVEPADVEW